MEHIKKFNEASTQRYFFDQDVSGHWYMIPAKLKSEWLRFTINDISEEDYDAIGEFEKLFNEYRLGGGITKISFENPIEDL